MQMAEISWSGSRRDQQALAQRPDWSDLSGLEQLWGRLAERHADATALDAPHAKPAEQLSFRDLHARIEQAAAGFAALAPLLLHCFSSRFGLRLRPPTRQEALQGW